MMARNARQLSKNGLKIEVCIPTECGRTIKVSMEPYAVSSCDRYCAPGRTLSEPPWLFPEQTGLSWRALRLKSTGDQRHFTVE